jgi:N-ethylmaleimide reductase
MKLLETFKLGDYELKNRVVLAPMTRARAGAERLANSLMATYYSQRASAGLLISEATAISRQALGWVNSPGIYTEEQTNAWKQVTDAVHKEGSKIFLQLWHCGRASHSSFHPNAGLAVAPSPLKIEEEYIHTPHGKQAHEIPRPLKLEEIPDIIQDYAKAAQNAKEAGFDGVEVHAANGYLIDQFIQSKTNIRNDKYGGSIENRCTFLFEILNEITKTWDANKVGIRISPNGAYNDMGSDDYREQFTYLAHELNQYKLAYLHIMDGLSFGFHDLGEPMTLAEFRKIYSGTIIGSTGYDKELAELRLKANAADMIAFGRPYISNPDLVERFRNNIPLNPSADMSSWYSDTGAEGYTDFPFATNEEKTAALAN